MWYHVAKKYLGETVILVPRIPNNANLSREGNIPRICVADTLFHCLRALRGLTTIQSTYLKDVLHNENPCVYFSEETPFIPPECDDFRFNGEMWFLKKTKFLFLGRIDIYALFLRNKIIPTTEKEIKFPKHNISIGSPKEIFLQELLKHGKSI